MISDPTKFHRMEDEESLEDSEHSTGTDIDQKSSDKSSSHIPHRTAARKSTLYTDLVNRSKIEKATGMSEKEIIAYDYINSINPKVFERFGDRPRVEELNIGYGVRLAIHNGSFSSTDTDSKIRRKGNSLNMKDNSSANMQDMEDLVETAAPRFVRLSKTLGLTEKQILNYDYIQSINPKVFDWRFGNRPTPDEISAPLRFKPRTFKDASSTRAPNKSIVEKTHYDRKRISSRSAARSQIVQFPVFEECSSHNVSRSL